MHKQVRKKSSLVGVEECSGPYQNEFLCLALEESLSFCDCCMTNALEHH